MPGYNHSRISVLLPVYNGELYVKEAVESILNQTFQDFELLIIDDGSTDKTEQIVQSFKDNRIVYVKNPKNQGLVTCLNQGFALAKTEFIARMDADDISFPTRLEKQYNFLNQHPEISIIGSHIQLMDSKGEGSGIYSMPLTPQELKVSLFFGSPFAHPTVMMRKLDFDRNNLHYQDEFKHAEDYDLWSRALQILKGANYDEVLLKYRISDQQIASNFADSQKLVDENIKKNLLRLFPLTEYQTERLFIFFQNGVSLLQVARFEEICAALEQLSEINNNIRIVEPTILKSQISEKIDAIVNVYSNSDNRLYSKYKKSDFFGYSKLSFQQKAKILLKQYISIPWS